MSLIPVQIGPGPGDPSAQLLPLSPMAIAIARLHEQMWLKEAFWGGKLGPNGRVVDRLGGTEATLNGHAPPVIGTSTMFSGWPIMDFTQSASSGFRSRLASYTKSWTAIVLFERQPTANSGVIAHGQGDGAVFTNCGALNFSAGGVLSLHQSYGTALINVPANIIRADRPNLVIGCADEATRSVALYVNSRTPVVASGVGSDPWGEPPAGAWWQYGGRSTQSSRTKIKDIATCSLSLHHTPEAADYLDAIFVAAEAEGVVLS